MWKSTVGGRVLHFRLAGINNQNFLMTDKETGTWWQQVSGKAVFGALKGQSLEAAPYDELTFGLWRQESPAGQVLAPVQHDESKYESNWEPEVQKLPTVIDFPGTGLQSRDVVIGLEVGNASRAYAMPAITAQSLILDRLGGESVLLVLGPDNKSVRAFVSRIDGREVELFRKNGAEWTLLDANGDAWNFQGCAITGPHQGKCLPSLPALKDYWFDWRNYHPTTTIYQH